MKNFLIVILTFLMITSCEKMKNPFEKHEKDKPCPTVNSESVPPAVKTTFANKYPGLTAENWYDKGEKGYSAIFTKNNIKNLATFDQNGNFVNEESDNDNQNENNNNDNNNNDDGGCSCNISEDND